MYSIKYDLLKRPLALTKTHDECVSGKPRLTVVMIHGIASSSRTYHNALKFLEGMPSLKGVRFVTYDLLGSGKSYTSDKLDYGYKEQLDALHNSITKLKLDTPLVLVGHSMGTLIATKYAHDHKRAVKHLILVSPPVYMPENLEDPKFAVAMQEFKKIVAAKDKKYIHDKAFDNEVEKIILNQYNYDRLVNLKTPTTMIYSEADQIIMPPNIRKVVRENKKYLSEIRTIGTHKVARDKYSKMPDILVDVLNNTK